VVNVLIAKIAGAEFSLINRLFARHSDHARLRGVLIGPAQSS